MANAWAYYALSQTDVDKVNGQHLWGTSKWAALLRHSPGRAVRTLVVGQVYPAAIVRNPVPSHPGDASYADLLVFVGTATPLYVEAAVTGSGNGQWFNSAGPAVLGGGS